MGYGFKVAVLPLDPPFSKGEVNTYTDFKTLLIRVYRSNPSHLCSIFLTANFLKNCTTTWSNPRVAVPNRGV